MLSEFVSTTTAAWFDPAPSGAPGLGTGTIAVVGAATGVPAATRVTADAYDTDRRRRRPRGSPRGGTT